MAETEPEGPHLSWEEFLQQFAGETPESFAELSPGEQKALRQLYKKYMATPTDENGEPTRPYEKPEPKGPGGTYTPSTQPFGGGGQGGDYPSDPYAPTGGLYGAFSGMAGGEQTPYEQKLGDAAMYFFQNPVNFLGGFASGQDENNLNLFRNFMGAGMNDQENSIWGALSGLMGGPSQNMNNVLGNYQWMASGLPTDAESRMLGSMQDRAYGGPSGLQNDVEGIYRWMASGSPTEDESGIIGQLKNALYGGSLGTGATPYETDVLGRYKDFSGKDAFGYEVDALNAIKNLGNPNAYGTQAGQIASVLGQMGMTGLEDYAQKVYGEMTGGAANPFEMGSWNTASDLSSGALTDPERVALAGYQGISGQGLTDDEKDLAFEFKKYGQAPGRSENAAFDVYKDMGQGYSDAEKEAIATQGMKAAREGYGQARDQMSRRAAATGQNAGYYGAISGLARGEAETMGSQARQNTMDFANEAERRKEVQGQGLTGLAGVEQRRGEFGLSGQGDIAKTALQRQLGGLGGVAGVAQNIAGRRQSGAELQRGVAGDITGRRMGATSGMQGVQRDMNTRMSTGADVYRGLGQDVQGGRQAMASGLQGWGNDFTQRQLQGTQLADQWNQTQFGQRGNTMDRLAGQLGNLRGYQERGAQNAQSLANDIFGQQGSALDQLRGGLGDLRNIQLQGTQGAQGWEQQVMQQILGATGQAQDLNRGLRGNQQWGAEQASNWMNDMWQRGGQAWDRSNQYAQQGRQNQQYGLNNLMSLYEQNDPMTALAALGGILSKPREVYSEGGSGSFDVGDL